MKQQLQNDAPAYLSEMKNRYRQYTRDWDLFAKEAPEKFMSLVRSGIKPSISRGNSSGHTLSVNLSFQTNMDAAKKYVEELPGKVEAKVTRFKEAISQINQKLERYQAAGVDDDVFIPLAEHLLEWIDFASHMVIDLGKAKISSEMSEETKQIQIKWSAELTRIKRRAEAKKYGVAERDLDRHKKYLEAKAALSRAKTSDEMQAAAKKFTAVAGYLDADQCAADAAQKASALQADEERKRREAEEEAKRKAQEAKAVWEAEVASIQKKKEAERTRCIAEVERAEEQKLAQIQEAEKQEMAANQRAVSAAEQSLADAKTELESLGFFKFRRKKELRDMIEQVQADLEQLKKQPEMILSKYRNQRQAAEKAAAEERNAIAQRLEREYVLPMSPEEKEKQAQLEKEKQAQLEKARAARLRSPLELANSGVKKAIWEFIKYNGPSTISDIAAGCPAAAELTNQRISALVRQMVDDGSLTRYEDKRKAFFTAN